MHEWSLAEAVVATALENAQKNHLKKITAMKVVLGELQQIEEDIFSFALNELKKETILEDAKIEIVVQEAVFKCRVCGHEWNYRDVLKTLDEETTESIHFVPELSHSFIKCPKCGSPDFEVIKGRGVWIEYIKGVGE